MPNICRYQQATTKANLKIASQQNQGQNQVQNQVGNHWNQFGFKPLGTKLKALKHQSQNSDPLQPTASRFFRSKSSRPAKAELRALTRASSAARRTWGPSCRKSDLERSWFWWISQDWTGIEQGNQPVEHLSCAWGIQLGQSHARNKTLTAARLIQVLDQIGQGWQHTSHGRRMWHCSKKGSV